MDGQTASSQALVAWASLAKGLLLLYVSIFTQTLSHWSLPYLRLFLAPGSMILFWNFGYGPYEEPAQLSPAISLYFMMRVLEHSVIAFLDPRPPRWAVHRPQSSSKSPIIIPLPDTFGQRCVYALDLLTSVRGTSWFSNWEWNWIPRSLTYRTPTSRGKFILRKILTFLGLYLGFDCCEVIFRSRSWDFDSHPITDLPVVQQVVFSIVTCAGMYITMSLTYTLISLVFVLCGSSPYVWPPLFNSPFVSKTLREFWSRRWHVMFRHVFEQISLPFVRVISTLGSQSRSMDATGRVANILRSFITFILSTLLHLIVTQRLTSSIILRRTGEAINPPFFDGSILRFFLLQPLGLLVEYKIVIPLADWVFPAHMGSQGDQGSHTTETPNGHADDSVRTTGNISSTSGIHPPARWERDALTRLYTWTFLIWTGRWWCDALIRSGFLNEDANSVPFSLIRGLWEGRWVI